MSEPPQSSIGFGFLVPALGITVLTYVAGAYVAEFDVFPYPQLFEPVVDQMPSSAAYVTNKGTPSFLGRNWHPTGARTFGTIRHRKSSTQNGYVFYSPGHRAGAALIDRSGKLVHKWSVPFEQVWSDPPHLADSISSDALFWQHAHLFDNGDVLATYAVPGKGIPFGGGLVKVDRDSNILWKYPARTHDDFGIGPDGDIYVLVHRIRDASKNPIVGLPQFHSGAVVEDVVVHLSPGGRERRQIRLLEAFRNGPFRPAVMMYPSTIERPAEKIGNPLHPNDIDVIGPAFASNHPVVEPGQLMMSFRAMDMIAVLDVDTRQIVWATRGVWWQQSDPEPLPDGRIQLFDTNGHGGHGSFSRILEVDPATGATEWMYSGTDSEVFWSYSGGSVETLPNDNRLVTSSSSGRLFEVTPEGELVWEYRNPKHRQTGAGTEISAVFSGRWVSPDTGEALR